MRKTCQIGRNLGALGLRGLVGVAVKRIAHLVASLFGQALQDFLRQFTRARSTKTNRVSHAFAQRHAIVGITRRQVKHVAGVQHKFLLGFKVGQNLQRHAGLQIQVFLPADAPAALAVGLQ